MRLCLQACKHANLSSNYVPSQSIDGPLLYGGKPPRSLTPPLGKSSAGGHRDAHGARVPKLNRLALTPEPSGSCRGPEEGARDDNGPRMVIPQDGPHGHCVALGPEICQGTLDAMVAPGGVLLRHAQDQLIGLLGDREHGDAGGQAAIGISSALMSRSGYQRLKMLANSPFSVRTRVCNNKCVPSLDHCIC